MRHANFSQSEFDRRFQRTQNTMVGCWLATTILNLALLGFGCWAVYRLVMHFTG